MKSKEEIQKKLETQLVKSKQLLKELLMAENLCSITRVSSSIDKLAGIIGTLRWVLDGENEN